MSDDYKSYLNNLNSRQIKTEESNLQSLVRLPIHWEVKAIAMQKLNKIKDINTKER